MAEEKPEIDWGEHPSNRRELVAPECGTVKKVEFSPHGDNKIIVRLTTEVGPFEFAMFRRHITSFIDGMREVDSREAERSAAAPSPQPKAGPGE
jgi:hypothetical protein